MPDLKIKVSQFIIQLYIQRCILLQAGDEYCSLFPYFTAEIDPHFVFNCIVCLFGTSDNIDVFIDRNALNFMAEEAKDVK